MAACRLYKLAREGKVVEREPRLVHVYRYTIDRIASPEIDFTVLCSKGFYVRTYVHDIGEVLGCGAHLKTLRRTKSGRFDVANAITVDEIRNATRGRNSQTNAKSARGFPDARSVRRNDEIRMIENDKVSITQRHPERSRRIPRNHIKAFATGFLDSARNDGDLIRHSSFVFHSSFVIRNSSFA